MCDLLGRGVGFELEVLKVLLLRMFRGNRDWPATVLRLACDWPATALRLACDCPATALRLACDWPETWVRRMIINED